MLPSFLEVIKHILGVEHLHFSRVKRGPRVHLIFAYIYLPSKMGPKMKLENLERICEHRDVPISHIRKGARCVVDFMVSVGEYLFTIHGCYGSMGYDSR